MRRIDLNAGLDPTSDHAKGPLTGVRVLDLSRILAGPTCTQLLGDLGATVLKIEQPQSGDDTRQWGPPYVAGAPDLSAYFLSANRNKFSLELDLATPEGQATLRRLAADADILVENFKVGGLAKYGLDYQSLKGDFPRLVYCSITGFGQTGPNRAKPGYDLMAQGYGGIMSLTGAPDGPPMKVGVAIGDVMTGMYAAVGILAALRHAEATGEGQQIDLALVDSQASWLINQGCNALTSGQDPVRQGNMHPNIVPYGVYSCADGYVIVAVGNDGQFGRFCGAFGLEALAQDPRFATNPARVRHRAALEALLEPVLAARDARDVIAALEAVSVPVGPVNTVNQVFASDQIAAREMQVDMHNGAALCRLIGNPLKLSQTPVSYREPPPVLGQANDLLGAEDIWAAAETQR